jgi:ankyrin repeat protein
MEKKLTFLLLLMVLALLGCGTSLGKAVSSGDRSTVIALLDQGADVNETGRSNFTPLHWAAYYGKDEMAKLLLDRGAKPNVQAGKYGTPLTMAAQYGFTEVVRLLLEKGADPNMADYYGKTPLQLAEARGYSEIIKLLNPNYVSPQLAEDPKEKRKDKPVAVVAKPVRKDSLAPRITITSPQVKRGIRITAKEESLTVKGYVEDESGVAWVIVNDQSAALDEKGNFAAEILLKVGENEINVEAMDIYKNQTSRRFTIARHAERMEEAPKAKVRPAPTTPPAMAMRREGRNYAFIIGINRYKNFDRLQTAVNDATGVADILQSDYGFQTELILDEKATRQNIMKRLNALKGKLNPEDQLLIYYAGHGYLDKETETSYWLPVDAERSDPTNWIEAKSVSDQLKRTRAMQVLVVADSCYAGTISRAIDSDLAGRGSRESYLQKLKSKPSRVLIASGGNEPVDDSGGRGHSVFADVFIRSLKNPIDQQFTAEELLIRQIKESVAGRAEQTPEYRVIRNSGHDGGDFVFIRSRER